jgi:uncharacterized protein
LSFAIKYRRTFTRPSAIFDSGCKKVQDLIRAGKDVLLVNSNEVSYISYADYVIAIGDEIENPKYLNERFKVVGENIK